MSSYELNGHGPFGVPEWQGEAQRWPKMRATSSKRGAGSGQEVGESTSTHEYDVPASPEGDCSGRELSQPKTIPAAAMANVADPRRQVFMGSNLTRVERAREALCWRDDHGPRGSPLLSTGTRDAMRSVNSTAPAATSSTSPAPAATAPSTPGHEAGPCKAPASSTAVAVAIPVRPVRTYIAFIDVPNHACALLVQRAPVPHQWRNRTMRQESIIQTTMIDIELSALTAAAAR